jgi:hypothetical protein
VIRGCVRIEDSIKIELVKRGTKTRRVMGVKLPNPKQGSADYQAKFSWPVFGLLGGSPPILYDHLFRALQKYETRLDDLKVEGLNTGGMTIIFESLVPNNFIVRVRLDSLQVTMHNLAVLGVEKAKQLVIDCWNAIQETDRSIVPISHTVMVAYQLPVSSEDYNRILQNFVKAPDRLPSQSSMGVVYYLLPRAEDPVGSIVLDRLIDGDLNLRMSMTLDANKVPLNELGVRVEEYINKMLSILDIEIEADK